MRHLNGCNCLHCLWERQGKHERKVWVGLIVDAINWEQGRAKR
jgi:hypothetical protein